MTRSELTSIVQKKIEEDAAQSFRWYTDQQIANALNDGLIIYSALTMCIETSIPIACSAGNAFYDVLNAEPRAIAVLRVTENGVRLAPDRIQAFKAGNNSWRLHPGPPERFAVVGANLLAAHPVPSSSSITLSVTLARTAAVMLFGSSIPEIPEEEHFSLAEYAAWFLPTAKEGASEKANQCLSRFLETVAVRIAQVRDRSNSRGYLTMPMPINKEAIQKLVEATSERRRNR